MSEFFLKLLNLSITASWLILAVIAVRPLLKKAPKWICCAIWSLVAIRLMCPFSFESALSLIPSSETIPYNVTMEAKPPIEPSVSISDKVTSTLVEQSFTTEPVASVSYMQNVIPVLSVVWIIGMFALLIYAYISYIKLKRIVSASIPLGNNIMACDDIKTPFIFGFLKPVIYVPSSLKEDTIKYVIAHETAHIRRYDYLWKPLGYILLTVYWFNPLCWIAYILLCRDIEMACDEKVICEMDNEGKAAYSQALLNCSYPRKQIAACPLAFGEVGVKERVKSVLNYKKPTFWIVVTAIAACFIVAVCFLTSPKKNTFDIQIVIPAGSQKDVVFSDNEISPIKDEIVITEVDNLSDTEVILTAVDSKLENGYDNRAYITPGMETKVELEKGGWYKIGISLKNDTDQDIIVTFNVKNIEARIATREISKPKTFQAKIVEMTDDYFIVEPIDGSKQILGSDRIQVSAKSVVTSPKPQVEDIIEIKYFGDLLETYPAQIQDVYSIRILSSKQHSSSAENDTSSTDDDETVQTTTTTLKPTTKTTATKNNGTTTTKGFQVKKPESKNVKTISSKLGQYFNYEQEDRDNASQNGYFIESPNYTTYGFGAEYWQLFTQYTEFLYSDRL